MGELRFSSFQNPALNGFLDDVEVQQHIRKGNALLSQQVQPVRPIGMIHHEIGEAEWNQVRQRVGRPPGRVFDCDFLNVDVKGRDQLVLESLNLSVIRPKTIMVEIFRCKDVEDSLRSAVAKCLSSQGYTLTSRLHFSALFADRAVL